MVVLLGNDEIFSRGPTHPQRQSKGTLVLFENWLNIGKETPNPGSPESSDHMVRPIYYIEPSNFLPRNFHWKFQHMILYVLKLIYPSSRSFNANANR